LRDREAAGEVLSEDELAFCLRHESEVDEDALEEQAWGEMISGLREEARTENDISRAKAARLGRASLDRYRSGEPGVDGARPTTSTRGRGALIASALAVAVGLAWIVLPELTADPGTAQSVEAKAGEAEDGSERGHQRLPAPDQERLQEATPTTAGTGPSPDAVLALHEGDVRGDDGALRIGASTRGLTALESGEGRGCLLFDAPFAVACMDSGTRLELVRELPDGERRIRLERGRVVVSLDSLAAGQGFAVDTPAGPVSAVGTIFEVEVDGEAENIRVAVSEGAVTVGPPPAARRLHAGQSMRSKIGADPDLGEYADAVPADPSALARGLAVGKLAELWREPARGALEIAGVADSPGTKVSLDGTSVGSAPVDLLVSLGRHEVAVANAVSAKTIEVDIEAEIIESLAFELPVKRSRPGKATTPASADELWQRAQAARKAGRYDETANLYQEMLERHPNHPRSRNVAVRLGDLLLSRDPKRAMAAYDRYLERGGALAPEAEFGRIRAFRALGQRSREKRAIEAFIEKRPRDMRSSSLRERLAEL
jgi:hypothetical protein